MLPSNAGQGRTLRADGEGHKASWGRAPGPVLVHRGPGRRSSELAQPSYPTCPGWQPRLPSRAQGVGAAEGRGLGLQVAAQREAATSWGPPASTVL